MTLTWRHARDISFERDPTLSCWLQFCSCLIFYSKELCVWHSFWKPPTHLTHIRNNLVPLLIKRDEKWDCFITLPWRHGMVCSSRSSTFHIPRAVVEFDRKGKLVDIQAVIVMSRRKYVSRLYQKKNTKYTSCTSSSSKRFTGQFRVCKATPVSKAVLPELRHTL
jgi:hypothetical protein